MLLNTSTISKENKRKAKLQLYEEKLKKNE